jgi:MFS family permease
MLTADPIVVGASLLFSAVLAALAILRSFLPLCAVMFVGGMAWLALLSSFNSVTQASVPAWVRGRALAFYLLVFFGGSAGGSILWGTVALHKGITSALLYAAIALAAGVALSARFRLSVHMEGELVPSLHWPEPAVIFEPHPDRGPVLVTVDYIIDPVQSGDFTREMHVLRTLRLRDGATNWWLFSDTAKAGHFMECFLVESWIEHLRQHERFTKADLEVENRVRTFHIGAEPPFVTHFLYEPEQPMSKKPG